MIMSTDWTFLQTMGISLTLLQERQMKWYIIDLHIYLCYDLSKHKAPLERGTCKGHLDTSQMENTQDFLIYLCCVFLRITTMPKEQHKINKGGWQKREKDEEATEPAVQWTTVVPNLPKEKNQTATKQNPINGLQVILSPN